MSTVLLKGGLVLTFKTGDGSAESHTPHAIHANVLIKGDRIIKVEPGLELPAGSDGEVVDCTGKWITPGQIDTHRHVWMSVMRGQQADWLLAEYLVKMTGLQLGLVTASEIYIGQLAGCLEAINAGVTTVVDHAHCINTPEHATRAIDATILSGIRSKFCYARQAPLTNVIPPERAGESAIRDWQMSQIEELAKKDGGRLSDRVELGLAYDGMLGGVQDIEPHKQVLDLARKYSLSPITTHYVGGPQGFFKHSINEWADAGLLKSDVLFSHANGLTHANADEREWQLLKDTGASIGSTPEDELGMAHGNPVAFEAVKRGVRVGLGVDCVSIQSADLFTQMRFALQWQRGHDNATLAANGKTPLYHSHTSASAFRLATLGGAEALHLSDKLGTIEPGKLADITIINVDSSINLAGCIDPWQGLVFWTKSEDVESVLVNGEWVKKNGELVRVKWGDVAGKLREAVQSVEARRNRKEEDELYTKATTVMGCLIQ